MLPFRSPTLVQAQLQRGRNARLSLGSSKTLNHAVRLKSWGSPRLQFCQTRLYAVDAEASNATTQPKGKGLFRRFVLPIALCGGVFYGAGIYASFQNEWVHDVFTDTVPLGEELVEYFEDYNLEKIGDVSKRAVEVTGGVIASAKNTLGFSELPHQTSQSEQPATAMKRERSEEWKSKAEANIEKMKAKTEAAVQRGQEIAAASKSHLSKTAQTLESTLVGEAKEAKEALKSSLPTPTTPSTSSSESISLSSPKSLPVYSRPIPIGHEPPPGYAGQVPKPRDPSTTAPPPPPSLPLLAPSVRDFSGSEPILGQLAGTIDNLAGFLRDNPEVAVRGKTHSGDDPTRVLENAEVELKRLGNRLEKIKTEERSHLERSLENQAKGYSKLLLDAERDLHERLDKQEDNWKEAFEKERQKLVEFYKTRLEKELESQQALIEERLKQEVVSKGLEMQRKWMRQIKAQVDQEREGRLSRLVELESCIKELGRATLDHELYLDQNLRVHKLWNGLRALSRVFDHSFKRSFTEEVHALKTINKPVDTSPEPHIDLVSAALSSLPPRTIESGVETLPNLTIWFKESVAPRLQSVTFFPDQGGFLSYLVSYFLSSFLFEKRASGWQVEGDNVMTMLARVEALLNGKDLDGATRELNRLKGWPKVLARDWLEAARRHLEVKQAVELIETEARLQSLLL